MAMWYASSAPPSGLALNLIVIGLLLAMLLSGLGGIGFLIVYLFRQSKEK